MSCITYQRLDIFLVSNYTGGTLGLLKLYKKGNLSKLLDVQQHSGKGTTDRQEAPHVHFSIMDNKTGNVLASDLGTNELWLYNLDTIQQKVNSCKNKINLKWIKVVDHDISHFILMKNGYMY